MVRKNNLLELKSIRNKLMVTSSVAFVFAASDGSDINWIIKLDGREAWFFLLLAHTYYMVSWNSYYPPIRKWLKWSLLNAWFVDRSAQPHIRQETLFYTVAIVMMWSALLVILFNFGYALYRASLPEPPCYWCAR